jgi:hypothetical protein
MIAAIALTNPANQFTRRAATFSNSRQMSEYLSCDVFEIDAALRTAYFIISNLRHPMAILVRSGRRRLIRASPFALDCKSSSYLQALSYLKSPRDCFSARTSFSSS